MRFLRCDFMRINRTLANRTAFNVHTQVCLASSISSRPQVQP
jgi:hypothetical protein